MTEPHGLPALAMGIQRAQDTADATGLRVGVVTGFNTGFITVSIGGSPTLVNATYLFGQYWPRLGEEVLVARLGASWVVLGALSAQSSNQVFNPSFELSATGSTPLGWTNLLIAGALPTTFEVNNLQDMPLEGPNQCHIKWTQASGGGSVYTMSRSIAVQPTQVWAVSGWVNAVFSNIVDGTGLADGVTVNIGASFYAHESDPLGTTVAADVFAGGAFPDMFGNTWLHLGQVSRGVTIPAGAHYMRVFLWTIGTFAASALARNIDVYWDRIIARQVS